MHFQTADKVAKEQEGQSGAEDMSVVPSIFVHKLSDKVSAHFLFCRLQTRWPKEQEGQAVQRT